MLKKFSSVILSLLLVVGLVACGGGSATNSSSDGDNSSVSSGGGSNANLKSQIQNCTPITEYTENTSVDQMDTIIFGMDKNGDTIEWIVLEKSNNKALLLSKYLLTSHMYNDEKVDITWENCTMRKWLNSEYINTIFSKKEQGSILTADVNNNDGYGTKGGNNTKDKLFILSIDEVENYFITDHQKVATYKGSEPHVWWLRSPAYDYHGAVFCVDAIGEIFKISYRVSADNIGVRPALWVKY